MWLPCADGEQVKLCAHTVIRIGKGQRLFDVLWMVCLPPPLVKWLICDAGFQKKKGRGKFW